MSDFQNSTTCSECNLTKSFISEFFKLKINQKQLCIDCFTSYLSSLQTPFEKLPNICKTHNKPLDLFCATCKILLCSKCIIPHKTHDIEDLEQLNDHSNPLKSEFYSKKSVLESQLNSLRRFSDDLNSYMRSFPPNTTDSKFALARFLFFKDKKDSNARLESVYREENESCSSKVYLLKDKYVKSQRAEQNFLSLANSLRAIQKKAELLRTLLNSANTIKHLSIHQHIKSLNVN